MLRIAIGSDHAGFELKQHFIVVLRAQSHEVTDLGTDSEEPCDYPQFCAAVGRAVRDNHADMDMDTFANRNVSAIVFEMDIDTLAPVSGGSRPKLQVWATTARRTN